MFGDKRTELPKDAAEHALFEQFNCAFKAEMEDKDGGRVPFRRWAEDGLWLYGDEKQIPAFNRSSGLRLPRVSDFRQGYGSKIYTQRDRVKQRAARYSIAETIEVDGQQRPRMNSEGRPIHTTEDGIRNFWRWFGESQAVDADGRPLVVYSGGSVSSRSNGPTSCSQSSASAKWMRAGIALDSSRV